MESAIFGQAISEYIRFKRIILWLILCVLCALLAFYWPHLRPDARPEEVYTSVVSNMVFHIVALASAILTTAIVSQEVEQRTIVYLLTRPGPRWKLLLIRYVASVIVVFSIGALGVGMVALATHYSNLVFKDLLGVAVGAFAYGALFLLISLLFNRAMLICLLYAFGWETSVPNMPGEMYKLSIFSYMQGLAQHPTNEMSAGAAGPLTPGTISATTAWLVMVPLTVVLLVIGALWFTTNEFVPREDAE